MTDFLTAAQIAALGGHGAAPLVQDVVTGKQIDKDGNQSSVPGYSIPAGGIPSLDLSNAVQTSLTKADNSADATVTAAALATKYVKPGTGIPSSDLDVATQNELNRYKGVIDSATQVIRYNNHTELAADGTTAVTYYVPTTLIQDLFSTGGAGFLNPLTGLSGAAVGVNIGQPLLPIANAVSAPYWTDPGLIAHTVGSATIQNNYPGRCEFTTYGAEKVLRLRTPAGDGDAAGNGHRRSQVRLSPVGNRGLYEFRMSLLIPAEDDACYDAASKYAYPVGCFQIQSGSTNPLWSLFYETTADPNKFRLFCRFRWSGDGSTTTPTYRAQFGTSSSGSYTPSGDLMLCNVEITRGTWYDIVLTINFDERGNSTTVFSGYAFMTINKEKVFEYSGPTFYMLGSPGGALTLIPNVYCFMYRHEFSTSALLNGGNGNPPANGKEYDLSNQTTPSPFTRVLLWREFRVLKIR